MSIRITLFFSFMVCAVISIALTMAISNWNLQRHIQDYARQIVVADFNDAAKTIAVNLSRHGPSYYESHRLLMDDIIAGVKNRQRYGLPMPKQKPRSSKPKPPPSAKRPRNKPPVLHRFSLLDAQQQLISGRLSDLPVILIPLKDPTLTILGYLAVPDDVSAYYDLDKAIRSQQLFALPLIAGFSLLVVSACAIVLSRYYHNPIHRLMRLSQSLSGGDYTARTSLKRNDELGELSERLNQLANVLAQSEQRRQRWLADISHELRTPLAILRGEIEALIDGIRPLTKDAIASMQSDIHHLQQLIEDLHQLSNIDPGGLRYQKSAVDLVGITRQAIHKHQALFNEKHIDLSFSCKLGQLVVQADSGRMTQVIDNLLTNSCKYTENNGRCVVSLSVTNDQIYWAIEDSAPGVRDEDFGKLFEYLYRSDFSRNRESGGSGLGLSICKQIVAAHGGRISARRSEMGGIVVEWSIPR